MAASVGLALDPHGSATWASGYRSDGQPHRGHRRRNQPALTRRNTLRTTLNLTVEIDTAAWAEAYGSETAADIRADVLTYLRTHVNGAAGPVSVIAASVVADPEHGDQHPTPAVQIGLHRASALAQVWLRSVDLPAYNAWQQRYMAADTVEDARADKHELIAQWCDAGCPAPAPAPSPAPRGGLARIVRRLTRR
ncbi:MULTISPECIES: hypothetical protein [unclassified Cellulomonas]|uniref:hypothetical protein n=1 Tax=unclassified Cellulomonas TaxID=2620175 RepID=UPI001C4F964D|nr:MULTISPECIES: hypothetical protein [unclassified Cellulomonas]MBW0254423.1 hypothetical protein [Cellulomonas sp. PS-H5]MCG7284651.1 hypothetical protein [Cellulomonas sp. ACRRI]